MTRIYPLRIIQAVSMTGAELRRHRKRLGLTQKAMADLLGLHWNSFARLERDEMMISEPVARLVRLLIQTEPSPLSSVAHVIKKLSKPSTRPRGKRR